MPLRDSAGRTDRLAVVVVESSHSARPASIRIAAAFARAGLGQVMLCHWRDLIFHRGSVAASHGNKYEANGGIINKAAFIGSPESSALFFYAPNSGYIPAGGIPLAERREAGIGVGGRSAYAIVDRLLLHASENGITTNAIGPDQSWGPKHKQETRLRRYEAATGRLIPRPRTHAATSSQLPGLISRFADSADMCVIKPASGDRGNGIRIVSPDDPAAWTTAEDLVIVQDLLPDPLLIGGHKADLRCYLLIDVDNATSSGRRGPVFVRRAPHKYRRGMVSAEVTNTAYRQRLGMPLDILPLEEVVPADNQFRAAVISQLDVLLDELTRAYFWDARCPGDSITSQQVPNRVILLGVDVLVKVSCSGPPLLFFLEANPFPGFYRGSVPCDDAIDQMLAKQYLPTLLFRQT